MRKASQEEVRRHSEGQKRQPEGQVMPVSFGRLLGRRGRACLVVALAVGATGVSAAPALGEATAEWHITMTHANPFGAEAELCPSKTAEPTANPPCGVDPLTEEGALGTGQSFAKESGQNVYKITVQNVGTVAAGKISHSGETL